MNGRDISMTSKEICAILEASKGTNVKEIKLKDLTIKFDNLTNQDVDNNNSTIAIPINSTSQTVENVEFLDKRDDESYGEIKDEFTMANLAISDPEAFEEYQRKA